MSQLCKSYKNLELNLFISTFIDDKQDIWFKGIDVANALEYENTRKAIRDHVDENYKPEWVNIKGRNESFPPIENVYHNIRRNETVLPVHLQNMKYQGGIETMLPMENVQPHTIFIKEPGLYSLIFSSKMPAAKQFQRWVFSTVLPNIRKHGSYSCDNNMLMFKIQNEYDLHTKVVSYIRRFHPYLLIVAGLGENQDSSSKRIHSYRKGYARGQPDLIINNYHKKYWGFCIEFKTPTEKGILSANQENLLDRYEDNGFKCVVSNDYDLIIKELNTYCTDIRLKCKYCCRRFITRNTLRNHYRYFHRISIVS